jgi:hypothetical protein
VADPEVFLEIDRLTYNEGCIDIQMNRVRVDLDTEVEEWLAELPPKWRLSAKHVELRRGLTLRLHDVEAEEARISCSRMEVLERERVLLQSTSEVV